MFSPNDIDAISSAVHINGNADKTNADVNNEINPVILFIINHSPLLIVKYYPLSYHINIIIDIYIFVNLKATISTKTTCYS